MKIPHEVIFQRQEAKFTKEFPEMAWDPDKAKYQKIK